METLDAIMTRRSVPKVTPDVPDRATIEKLLEAAVRAPTHHLTQPWRFVVLAGDAIDGFADAWASAEPDKDAALIRDKAHRAPVIIVVIARPHLEHPKVVETEEHMAIGAAIQNILLAAHTLGLGAMIRTGATASHAEVREHLGVRDDESVAGFIYVGIPPLDAPERPMTRRAPAGERTEWRGWL